MTEAGKGEEGEADEEDLQRMTKNPTRESKKESRPWEAERREEMQGKGVATAGKGEEGEA